MSKRYFFMGSLSHPPAERFEVGWSPFLTRVEKDQLQQFRQSTEYLLQQYAEHKRKLREIGDLLRSKGLDPEAIL